MKKNIILFLMMFLFINIFSQKIIFKDFSSYYNNKKIEWKFDISYDGSILYFLNFKTEEIPYEMEFITEYKSVLISGEKKGYLYKLNLVAKNIDREILGESNEATLIVYDDEEEPLRVIGGKVKKYKDKKTIHFILKNVSSKIIKEFELRYWGIDILGNPIRINRRSVLRYNEKGTEIKPFEYYNVYIDVYNEPNLRFIKGEIWKILFEDDTNWEKVIY
ncbi:hypothetical protein [Marinitoga aeolica]|uniref:Uncharacterized protein n=1 Tax=Marinitoga aeolica TaxID=2809031 RepID=A0ABY8PR25_9BACT|nr:hypothetical protein [Marinitoga aeolica]WGS65071.1 hypothetical protein JRV97_00520 [Marinitoga aeolica]